MTVAGRIGLRTTAIIATRANVVVQRHFGNGRRQKWSRTSRQQARTSEHGSI